MRQGVDSSSRRALSWPENVPPLRASGPGGVGDSGRRTRPRTLSTTSATRRCRHLRRAVGRPPPLVFTGGWPQAAAVRPAAGWEVRLGAARAALDIEHAALESAFVVCVGCRVRRQDDVFGAGNGQLLSSGSVKWQPRRSRRREIGIRLGRSARPHQEGGGPSRRTLPAARRKITCRFMKPRSPAASPPAPADGDVVNQLVTHEDRLQVPPSLSSSRAMTVSSTICMSCRVPKNPGEVVRPMHDAPSDLRCRHVVLHDVAWGACRRRPPRTAGGPVR